MFNPETPGVFHESDDADVPAGRPGSVQRHDRPVRTLFRQHRPAVRRTASRLCRSHLPQAPRGAEPISARCHAIALCNAAELAAGTMTDASIPAGHRWIPRGMTVEYLAKATGDVRAVADGSQIDWQATGNLVVPVVAYVDDKPVFRAEITMYVSQA
ncbi:DUF4442 domain-containing protein [Pseudomonas aeruginosa]